MNSTHSQKFWHSLGLVAASCLLLAPLNVEAQPLNQWPIAVNPQPRSSPASTAETARAFLQVNRVQHLCQQPFAFSVMKGSLEDIAEAVQKVINPPDATTKIRVEVRDVQPVRLTFAAKTSTVGNVLSSAAMLANAQLWVFGDHILLAPRQALTPDEVHSVEKGLAIEAQGQSDRNESQLMILQHQVFTAFIGDELKGRKPTVGKSPLSDRFFESLGSLDSNIVTTTTFGQLSPDAQEMLQELSLRQGNFLIDAPLMPPIATLPDLSLSPGSLIAITARKEAPADQDLHLFFPGADGMNLIVNWGVGLSRGGYMIGGSSKSPSQAAPPASVPLDLSAGKS